MGLASSDRPGSGTAPSCRIKPSWSSLFRDSAILPPSMRYTEMPVNSTVLSVGVMPKYSPGE